jgi:hypothetical protein
MKLTSFQIHFFWGIFKVDINYLQNLHQWYWCNFLCMYHPKNIIKKKLIFRLFLIWLRKTYSKSQEQAGFSNAAVSDKKEFKQVIAENKNKITVKIITLKLHFTPIYYSISIFSFIWATMEISFFFFHWTNLR